MAKNNSNLVRPRTVMQDSPTSLSSQHNHHRPHIDTQKHRPATVKELILCGACMFLFIVCVCFGVALALLTYSLQNGVLTANCSEITSTGGCRDNIWNTILHFLTNKFLNSNHLFDFANDSSSNRTNQSNGGIGDSNSMENSEMSKVIQQLSWRLPREIKPKHYDLILRPNLTSQTFTGNVSIDLDVIKPISFIAVHAQYLNITQTSLVKNVVADNATRPVRIAKTFAYPKFEYWITELDNPLDVGEYTLSFDFDGSLKKGIVGFYGSSYRDAERNVTRLIATSKFEPTYARRAYPCFDEPAMKAKFTTRLVQPLGDGYTSLSNMNEVERIDDVENGVATIAFNTSVPMSTYLSCFIVADFIYRSKEVNTNGIGQNFELRVYSSPGQIKKVDFALETGVKAIEYFINYFQIEYPLPKLDLVAIPDFVSGAMEHWGVVTFRETALLFDSNSSSLSNKQRVAQVVSHELAHSWFGNLVTMDWWNDLWLNEGFAQFMEYKAQNHIFPEWGILDDFVARTLQGVMKLDATLASHPIVQFAETPDQITELFDSITYSKGASIIRMLADYVGDEKFAKAVTNYLNAHKYGSAVTDDLLTEIEKIDDSNKEIKLTMATWTKQSGFPVVNVERISPSEYQLKQKRFLSNPAHESNVPNDSEFHYRWSIPLTYVTSDRPNDVQRKFFPHADLTVSVKVSEAIEWIKFNKDQVGYYLVNYPIDIWNRLSSAFSENHTNFSVSDRANLLYDSFSLAEATQVEYSVALDFTRYLSKEDRHVPWYVAALKLKKIGSLLSATQHYPKFETYARDLVTNQANAVGWKPGNDLNQNQLRATVLSLACHFGQMDCLEKADELFNEWLKDPTQRPHPDIRTLVYNYGVRMMRNVQNWDIVWKLYLNETDAQEKVKLASALAAAQSPSTLKRYIELAWDGSNVRSQDYFQVLQNVADNPIGELIVWDYVRENWQKLVERFGLNERYLGRMIPAITSRFSTTTRLDEMNGFFAKYPDAGAGASARKEAIQNVENNIQWLKDNERKVVEWIEKNSPTNQI